ncbi:hypothetical protein DYBT9275_00677 [Dyadobacter sp. CECT 9275]|uniref:Sigma-70 family RNA polymerase sigma factor n=1 Tax=Dyadobacter helix TaxID=2822344 RepID=A0A916JC45_9BACT|nr:hypothetical protein [Dyadobacter sp. CECT 9275]CAG4991094.1 hypothetical protein DYBT9275_00677 [Dyadobacter sp. CECT 9275]
MTELDQLSNFDKSTASVTSGNLTSIEVYDKFGAMAYGIILQIIPQPHLAQEILVEVFASPLLQSCNSYPFSFGACVIKLARAKAVEAKRKLMSVVPAHSESTAEPIVNSPQLIFDLAFCQGYTPDEVAEKLSISKSEVLKSFHDFFQSSRNS